METNTNAFAHHVACAECRADLFGTPALELAENVVLDYDGEVDYIELMHEACAPAQPEPDYEHMWETGRRRL